MPEAAVIAPKLRAGSSSTREFADWKRRFLENDPKFEVRKSSWSGGFGSVSFRRTGKGAERLRGQIHSAVRGLLGWRGIAGRRLYVLNPLRKRSILVVPTGRGQDGNHYGCRDRYQNDL